MKLLPRQFATITRNYAKRQLQWYRKDDAFLWLKIDRSSKGISDPAPYNKVCKELQYWVDVPQIHFKEAVKQQMLRGLAVSAAKNRKNHGHKNVTRDEYDILALQAVAAEKAHEAMVAAETMTKQSSNRKKKNQQRPQQDGDDVEVDVDVDVEVRPGSPKTPVVEVDVAGGDLVVPFNFRSTARFNIAGGVRPSLSLANLPMAKNDGSAGLQGGRRSSSPSQAGEEELQEGNSERDLKKAKLDFTAAAVSATVLSGTMESSSPTTSPEAAGGIMQCKSAEGTVCSEEVQFAL